MAAIVCHGFQSHLESQLVESRTLRLRLPSSKSLPSQPIDLSFKSCFYDSSIKPHYEENSSKTDTLHDNPISSNPNNGGWNFLEALSNVSKGPKESSQKETTYVHPQEKRSSLLLSPKSLELCTENLGNESGTDITENGIDMLSSSDRAGGNLPTREQAKPSQLLAPKKAKTQNFPPPLTTIRGSESLRVRPHREDGRLVIEVTKVPPSASCFQAERSHGRLRLCFLKNHTPSFDPEEDATQDNEPTTNEGFVEEFESEMNGPIQHVEEEEEEEGEEEEEEEDDDDDDGGGGETEEKAEQEEDVACGCVEIKGNSSNIGVDMRMGKYERPSRCKEGDHENNELLYRGEPLWVVTS